MFSQVLILKIMTIRLPTHKPRYVMFYLDGVEGYRKADYFASSLI